VIDLGLQILRTDVAGMPMEWINYQDAARLYHVGQVAYTCGERLYEIHGGVNARSGIRSTLDVHSIIATYGNNKSLHDSYIPPLNNRTLFKRDAKLCLYCGDHFDPTKQAARQKRRACNYWLFLSCLHMQNISICKAKEF